MTKVISLIKDRMARYEQATGNWLPLNALARVTEIGTTAVLAFDFANHMSPENMIVPGLLLAGAAAVDLSTYNHDQIQGPLNDTDISGKID